MQPLGSAAAAIFFQDHLRVHGGVCVGVWVAGMARWEVLERLRLTTSTTIMHRYATTSPKRLRTCGAAGGGEEAVHGGEAA